MKQNLWRTLVFWLWLGTFVFSFVAGDYFHSANCPEHSLLKWASHSSHASFDKATLHSAGADIDCAACAVHSVDVVMVEGSIAISLLLQFSPLRQETPLLSRPPLFSRSIARGPPVLD